MIPVKIFEENDQNVGFQEI